MKDTDFILLQPFMVEELKLKGNELIVYAAIYSFTKDGEHWFHGTRGYLAKWCGSTKTTVSNCLKSLVEKGLLEKRIISQDGYEFIHYRAVVNFEPPYKKFVDPPTKNLDTPLQNFCSINNIENDINILNNIDNIRENQTEIKTESKRNQKREVTLRINDERKEYDFPIQCLKILNEETNKNFRSMPMDMARFLVELSQGGYTAEDIRKMIRHKNNQWGNDQKMNKYLKPDTLFRVSNVERYLEESKNFVSVQNDFSYLDEGVTIYEM